MATYCKLSTCGDDVKFWDFPSLTIEKELNVGQSVDTVSNISWSHDGMQLACVPNCADNVVLTWVKNSVYSTVDLKINKQLRYVRFMKQSSWCLGLGCNNGRLLVWDLKSKRCKNEYVAATRDSSITCLEFNWNDSSCCCGYDNGDVIIYNLVTGQPSKPMKSKTNQAIRSLQYNHLRKSILGTASDYGTVTLWDVNAKSEIHSFNTSHVAPATGLCFSPVNDILLMSVGLDKNIVCYDVHSKKPVQTMSAESPLTCIDLMSDGMTLAVGTSRGKILMYDLRQSSIPFKTVSAHRTSVTGVAFQKISDGPQRQSSSSKSSTMKSKAVQIGSKVKVKQFYDSDDNSVQSAIREDVIEGGSVDFSPKRPSRRSLTAQIFSPVKDFSEEDKINSSSFQSGQKLQNETAIRDVGVRSSLSHQIFSPLSSTHSSTSSLVGADAHSSLSRLSSKHDESNASLDDIDDHSTLQIRRQPIGGGFQKSNQSFSVIGDRPVTAGSAESEIVPAVSDLSASISADNLSSNRVKTTNGVISAVSDSCYNSQTNNSDYKSSNMATSATLLVRDKCHTSFSEPLQYVYADIGGSDRIPCSDHGLFSPLELSENTELDSTSAEIQSVDVGQPNGILSATTSAVSMNDSQLTVKESTENKSNIAEAVLPESVPKCLHCGRCNVDSTERRLEVIQKQMNDMKDDLEDFQDFVHRDFLDLHMDMLKQFQIQMNDIQVALQRYSINEDLLQEIEALKKENVKLRSIY